MELRGPVADVMLDRPQKMNAVDLPMFEALSEAADYVAGQSQVRAVVLHGNGGNFCAGIDLGVLAAAEIDFHDALASPIGSSPANLFQRAAYAWRELPQPVIAALEGVTFGAGFQIAMGADVRFASADTTMAIMESNWGIIPDMGLTATVRDILPPDKVKELAWSGRKIAAEEALALGLVTAVCEDPRAAALALASECAGRNPDAIRAIKQLVGIGWTQPEAESLRLEARLQSAIIGSENQREAVQANLQKRAPDFTD